MKTKTIQFAKPLFLFCTLFFFVEILFAQSFTIGETHSKLCNGIADGSINITVSGGASGSTYSYLWTPGSSTSQNLTGLLVGTYTVKVTEQPSGDVQSLTIPLIDPSALAVTILKSSVLCYGESSGSANAIVSGGTPLGVSGATYYQYVWSTGATTQQIVGLPTGPYSVTVTDNNNCTATSSFSLSQPSAPLSATLSSPLNQWGFNVTCGQQDGSTDLTPSGGTMPYSYSWNSASGSSWTTQDLTGLDADHYTIKVTDANACKYTTRIDLTKDQPCPGKYWYTIGNVNINPVKNFVGTTDAQPLVFRTNNLEDVRIINNGNVGIGTSQPAKALHIYTTHAQSIQEAPRQTFDEVALKLTDDVSNIDGDIKIRKDVEMSPSGGAGPTTNISPLLNVYGPQPSYSFPSFGIQNGLRQGIRLQNLETNTGAPFCSTCPSSINSVWDIEPLASSKGTMLGFSALGDGVTNRIMTLMATQRVGINTNDPKSSLQINKDRSVNFASTGGSNSVTYGEYIGFNTVIPNDGTNQLVKLRSGVGSSGDQRGGAVILCDYFGNLNFQMYDPDLGTASTTGPHSNSQANTSYKPQFVFTTSGTIKTLNSATGNYSTMATGWSAIQSPCSNTGMYYNITGGRVGIGIDCPNDKLDVSGFGRFSDPGNAGNYIRIGHDGYNSRIDAFDGGPGGNLLINYDSHRGVAIYGPVDMCQHLTVHDAGWCDFVFADSYKRMSIPEKTLFITRNKHLPYVPSGKEIETSGMDVGEVMKGMQQNTEENTLDIIDLHSLVLQQKKEIELLKQEVEALKRK